MGAREPRVRRAQEGEQVAPLARRATRSAAARAAPGRTASGRAAAALRARTARRASRTPCRAARASARATGRRSRSRPATCPSRSSARISSATSSSVPRMPAPSRKRSDAVQLGPARAASAPKSARSRWASTGVRASAARRKLLDPAVGQPGEVVRGARERREGIAARLVRQRDGHVGARGERLEQRPLGAGQVLEAVREDGPRLPGAEVTGGALGRVPALELAVPDAEPVELARGRQRRAARARRPARPARAARTRARTPSSRASRRTRRSERSDPRRHATMRRRSERPLRGRDHAPVGSVAARDPLEDVVEGADRAADERAGPGQQLALGTVDVRPVRHDQDRIGVERAEVALEQERDLARVRGPCEQAQRHPPHRSDGVGQLRMCRPVNSDGRTGTARTS